MTRPPALTVALPRADVTGVAVVLHGGRERSVAATRSHQLAVLRMLPFAAALRRAGAEHGLAVARLRFAVRGWNGDAQSPVADACWALDELARRFPAVPAALVGHSMGGRAALHAAGHPSVQSVVGLAPWIEAADPVAQLAGRRVLLMHGTRDRVTSPRGSAGFAERAADVAASISYVQVRDDRHAMLRRAGLWHELAAGFVIGTLYGGAADMNGRSDTREVLTKALAGYASFVV